MSRPFSVEACDFSGWATRNDLKCSDGRVIRRDAFKNNDGIKVPLVWNHQHNSPRDVLGHAWLENREEGVYTYGFLNDTADGEIAKVLIKHGDICALSIYANQLQQTGSDVLHGCICEVSLVHKGANPGAFIDSMLKHGEMSDDEAIIYTGMPLCLSHSAESKDDPEDEEKKKDSKEDKPAENKEEKKDNEETIADVIDSMSEKQQNVMYALIAQALEGEPEKESKDDSDNKSESNKEDNTMKHNVFDNDQQKKTEVLSHADQASIISMAKSNSVGSLRTAMDIYAEQNPDSVLAHGIDGNYDRNNNQIDHFYTPIYFGSSVNGKLRSLSGKENNVNMTASADINGAIANGDDWYVEVLADRLLLQDLLVMMARSTECQTAFGYGRCKSSNSNAIAPGTMNTKGMFWGSNDQTSGVKVFGMENVWGNLWRRTAGWINANGTQKVKLTRGTHDGSTVTDYNTDGNGYKTIANATPAGSSGGYISSMKTEAFGRLPVNASGSSSTYEADGMWYNNGQVNYAYVGGHWGGGLVVGPFYACLDTTASYSNSALGAALSCKPLAAA